MLQKKGKPSEQYFLSFSVLFWSAFAGLGDPGGGFGAPGPGTGFSDDRSSGKPRLLQRLKSHPQEHQNHHQDHPSQHKQTDNNTQQLYLGRALDLHRVLGKSFREVFFAEVFQVFFGQFSVNLGHEFSENRKANHEASFNKTHRKPLNNSQKVKRVL